MAVSVVVDKSAYQQITSADPRVLVVRIGVQAR